MRESDLGRPHLACAQSAAGYKSKKGTQPRTARSKTMPCTASNGLDAVTLPRLVGANGRIVKQPTCYHSHNSQFSYLRRTRRRLQPPSQGFFAFSQRPNSVAGKNCPPLPKEG